MLHEVPEILARLVVAVHQQVANASQESIAAVGEVSGNVLHQSAIGLTVQPAKCTERVATLITNNT